MALSDLTTLNNSISSELVGNDSVWTFNSSIHCKPPDHLIDNYVEFLLILSTYGITFFVGLIGNGLIIYTVLHFRKMRTLPNIFLANLAAADLLLIVICVPIKVAQLFSFTWEMGWFLCKLVHYMQNISAMCSVYTLTTISVERYYAIIHPVRSRATCSMGKTIWLIVSIWLASFLLALPVLLVRIMYPIHCNRFYCIPDYDSKLIVPYEVFMLCTILILPTIILVYTYSRICHCLSIVLLGNGQLNTGIGESIGNELNVNYAFLFLPNCISLSRVPSDYENHTSHHTANPLVSRPQLARFHMRSSESAFVPPHTGHRRRSSICNESSVQSTRLDQTIVSTTVFSAPKTEKSSLVTCINDQTESARPLTQAVSLRNDPVSNISCTTTTDHKSSQQIRRHSGQMKRVCNDKGHSKDQKVKQVIKMLVVVVVVFILCWAPILTFNLMRACGIVSRYNHGHLKTASIVFHLLSYLNSAVNPLIYGFMSKHFWKSFRRVFTLCLGKRPTVRQNQVQLNAIGESSMRIVNNNNPNIIDLNAKTERDILSTQ